MDQPQITKLVALLDSLELELRRRGFYDYEKANPKQAIVFYIMPPDLDTIKSKLADIRERIQAL